MRDIRSDRHCRIVFCSTSAVAKANPLRIFFLRSCHILSYFITKQRLFDPIRFSITVCITVRRLFMHSKFLHSIPVCLLVLLCTLSGVQGAQLMSDSAMLRVHNTGEWIACNPESVYTFTHGDSLYAQQKALLVLSPACSVMAAQESRLSFSVQNKNVTLHVQQGKCFIRRTRPHTYDTISLHTLGCGFTLKGTQAALKITPQAMPTVAVIEGTILAATPNGEVTEVTSGSYATLDPQNNRARSGALSPDAISQILAWSGIGTRAAPSPSPAVSDSAPHTPDTSAADTDAADTSATTDTSEKQKSQTPQTDAMKKKVAVADTASEKKSAPAEKSKPAAEPTPEPDKEAPAPAPGGGTAQPGPQKDADTTADKEAEAEKKPQKADKKKDGDAQATSYQLSVGSVTIEDEQWTRIAFGIDVPLWKFGVFFDLEFFLTEAGQLSDKGWQVKDDKWQEFMMRKIRYVRFGRENDPLFVKLGGLDNVSMGYGFIVDGFTNMLDYPEEKLLGLQFQLNDLSAVGFSLHAMTPDIQELLDKGEGTQSDVGGIIATRVSLTPLKRLTLPFVNSITTGVSVAIDRNQYAPAREWEFSLKGPAYDRDSDSILDSSATMYNIIRDYTLMDSLRRAFIDSGVYDTVIEDEDRFAERKTDKMVIAGLDAGMPLWQSPITSGHVYGHAAARLDTSWSDDKMHDWGFGFPGFSFSLWKFNARIEYRHVEGKFEPGYFGRYYLEERINRDPVYVKEDSLSPANLNGVFGTCGFSIAGIVNLTGSYQRMAGEKPTSGAKAALDQRFSLSCAAGEEILSRIPRIARAQAYFDKTDMQRTWMLDTQRYDHFFEKTPNMYYGYRAGVKLAESAMLIADMRYGWHWESAESGYVLVPSNNLQIQTVLQF